MYIAHIFLKTNNFMAHMKISSLYHHLQPTQSFCQCLYLQRSCLLTAFSYFLRYFAVKLWCVAPQPSSAWGKITETRLYPCLLLQMYKTAGQCVCSTEGRAELHTHTHTHTQTHTHAGRAERMKLHFSCVHTQSTGLSRFVRGPYSSFRKQQPWNDQKMAHFIASQPAITNPSLCAFEALI